MANENWAQEKIIIDEFKSVYERLFALEAKLTKEFRGQVYSLRCQLTQIEQICRLQVRHVARDGSSIWLKPPETSRPVLPCCSANAEDSTKHSPWCKG